MVDIELLYSKYLQSNGISIDTRTITEGNLFFAINGPNFNANKFAEEALKKGASFAVVDDEEFVLNEKTILVADGLIALQNLASYHRDKFNGPVLAITGSNGKTTTKELISKVLSEKYIIHATIGNYNNHIGVPLTLLGINEKVEIAVIEMGANHVGEIANLCEIAKPTHGLITNIGRAHTETFGGIEGVIRGKSELFDFIKKNGGNVFVNMNDPVLKNMAKRFLEPNGYPSERIELIHSNPFLEFRFAKHTCSTRLIGKYNFINIATAIAIGKFFDVADEKILNAISTYEPGNARSQIIKQGKATIILDAYNANPDSMKVALENLAEQKGRKIAILGDMNEVKNPEEAHQEVLDYACELNLDRVITVGEKIGKVAEKKNHFHSKEELENVLSKMNFGHTTILLKASRSIKLETILKSIQ